MALILLPEEKGGGLYLTLGYPVCDVVSKK
jgi:hypothetical protein